MDDEAAGAVLTAARDEDSRVDAERRQLRRLPLVDVELPLVATERFGRAEVAGLAEMLHPGAA